MIISQLEPQSPRKQLVIRPPIMDKDATCDVLLLKKTHVQAHLTFANDLNDSQDLGNRDVVR